MVYSHIINVDSEAFCPVLQIKMDHMNWKHVHLQMTLSAYTKDA